MNRKGDSYYYTQSQSGKRVWTPLGRDLREALTAYEKLAATKVPREKKISINHKTHSARLRKLDMRAHLKRLHAAAVTRSRTKGIVCDLSVGDVFQMFHQSLGRCAVTNVEFSLDWVEGSRLRPFSPSIDRIEPAKGYVRKNCRLVCVAANFSMNQWGEETFKILAESASKKTVFVEERPNLVERSA